MGKLNWEKAKRQEKAGSRHFSHPWKGTPKQRALIKALTKELGWSGAEKQDLWGRIGVSLTASEAIDDLIAQKRAMQPGRNHLAAIRDEVDAAA